MYTYKLKFVYFSLDINVANRMCNFAIEFDVENIILNTLCRASWLFDHDMFEVNLYFILKVKLCFYNLFSIFCEGCHQCIIK